MIKKLLPKLNSERVVVVVKLHSSVWNPSPLTSVERIVQSSPSWNRWNRDFNATASNEEEEYFEDSRAPTSNVLNVSGSGDDGPNLQCRAHDMPWLVKATHKLYNVLSIRYAKETITQEFD